MARGEIPIVVTNSSTGDAVVGATAVVNIRGGGVATVYQDATTSTPVSPLLSNAAGRFDGWLDDGSYDIQITGSGITSYTQALEVVNGAAINAFQGSRLVTGTVAGTALANLGVTGAKIATQTITRDKLDANVIPIGTIIQWWRPSNSHAIPTGWLECDGSSVIAANHEFTGGGTINIPDLRNKYVLGANSATAYNTAGTATDANTGAPGVTAGGNSSNSAGGSSTQSAGGSNTLNLNHRHSMPHDHNYSHSHGTADHTHHASLPDHTHGFQAKSVAWDSGGGALYGIAYSTSTGGVNWRAPSGGTLIDFLTEGASATGTTSQSTSTTGAASNSNTDYQLNSPQDSRPRSFGLIYLIKVKASTP
jgi:hypothetical protein